MTRGVPRGRPRAPRWIVDPRPGVAVDGEPLGRLAVVLPAPLAGGGLEREHLVRRRGQVDHVPADLGRTLDGPLGVIAPAHLPLPWLDGEQRTVVGADVDLIVGGVVAGLAVDPAR